MRKPSKITRALTVAALAVPLGVGGATVPAVVAAPSSPAGPQAAEAANVWGKVCFVRSYFENAARTKMRVEEYRIYLTPGTKSYGGCYLYKTYVTNGVPWAVS